MPVSSLDHLVLTVADLDATLRFHEGGLGMGWSEFAPDRCALAFGCQKLNLHRTADRIEPRASRPTPGSADLCFLVDEPLEGLADRLGRHGFPLLEDPVGRGGAPTRLGSIHLVDPDGNLVELSRPAAPAWAQGCGRGRSGWRWPRPRARRHKSSVTSHKVAGTSRRR